MFRESVVLHYSAGDYVHVELSCITGESSALSLVP